MAERTRCKFVCEKAERPYEGADHVNVELRAQYESENPVPEDERFSRYTPCGFFSATISNPSLDGFFQPGKAYYLDITPATA